MSGGTWASLEAEFAEVVHERDEARRERDEALSRVAAEAGKDLAGWAADLDAAEAAHARVVAERDEARADVERLRGEHDAEVETVQRVFAYVHAELEDARAEVDRARADVERIRSAYERYGAAGVASVLAELSHRVGHPSDSTR